MAGHVQRERERSSSTSRPLHNFTLPSRLKWGHQKQLRCVKLNQINNSRPNSTTPHTNSAADHRRNRSSEPQGTIGLSRRSSLYCPTTENENSRAKRKSPISAAADGGADDEIEVVREKLMTDLRVAADRMKLSMLNDKSKDHNVNNNNSNNININNEKKQSEEDLNSARPWNLRTRRAACKAPVVDGSGGACGTAGGGGGGSALGNANLSPLRRADSRLRCLTAVDKSEKGEGNNCERPKFSPTLTKEEIEFDFLAMTGAKPHRRPKKRPRTVQKQLETVYPGSWLTEITLDLYKVPENAEQ